MQRQLHRLQRLKTIDRRGWVSLPCGVFVFGRIFGSGLKLLFKYGLKYVLIGAIACSLVLWGLDGEHFATAQGNRNLEAAEQAYAQLPEVLAELPRANDYRSASSGEVQDHNTLLYRLIYYHTRTKRRAPFYRFDWKLTLADYLEANELMPPDRYPTATVLDENPLERDRAILDGLNLQQRSALVDLLVVLFEGKIPPPPEAAPPEPVAEPDATPEPARPVTPQPGDAELLL
ncbi:MAG: hypothetical protein ACPGVO_07555 [Spirulinaceae cyanobacterium]